MARGRKKRIVTHPGYLRAFRNETRLSQKMLNHINRTRSATLNEYERFFSFEDEEIFGKQVLDVGASRAVFQSEAEEIGAKVFSLDPSYVKTARITDKKRKAAGTVQRLPFNDETFHITFARRVVPDRVYYLERFESIAELFRVTKKAGWVGIGPFIGDKSGIMQIKEVKSILRKAGYDFVQHNTKIMVGKRKDRVQTQMHLKITNIGNREKLLKQIEVMKREKEQEKILEEQERERQASPKRLQEWASRH